MLQGALAGVASGGFYAVVAVCLVLMARLVRVVNFSQTAIGMFGAFSAVALTGIGLPTWLAAIVGVAVGGLISALTGLIIATWLAEADVTVRSAVTVAVLLILVALSFILFGTKPLPFTPVLSGPAFSMGQVVVSQVTLALLLLAIVIAVLSRLLLTRTTLGLKLRALSERPITAELIGIRSRRLSVAAWIATGVISSIVITVVAPNQSNDAISLATAVVPASAAALAGGFRRLDLAVIGGLLLGMLDGALAQYESLAILRYFLPFLVIVAMLLWLQRREVWDAAR